MKHLIDEILEDNELFKGANSFLNSWAYYKDEELKIKLDLEYIAVCQEVETLIGKFESEAIKANMANAIYRYLDSLSSRLLHTKGMSKKKRDKTIKAWKRNEELWKIETISKTDKNREILRKEIIKMCEKSSVSYIKAHFKTTIDKLEPFFY